MSFVVTRSPLEAFSENWTFVCLQGVYCILALASFRHAWTTGTVATIMWLAAVGHGLVVEGFCYAFPSLDSFYHGRAVVSLFEGRMPLYVVVLYPAFYHCATTLVVTLAANLGVTHPITDELRGISSEREQPQRRGYPSLSLGTPVALALATGLITALCDVGYDVLGPPLLWWQWHVDDPNTFERGLPFVPLTSFVFHMTFASSWFLLGTLLSFSFSVTNKTPLLSPASLAVLALSSVLAFPFGAMQIQPLYVVPHDLYGVPTVVCLFATVCAYVALVVGCARGGNARPAEAPLGVRSETVRLFSTMQFFALFFVIMAAVVSDPSTLTDSGIHQPVAWTPEMCAKTEAMVTVAGTVYKHENLCADQATGEVEPGSRDKLDPFEKAHYALPFRVETFPAQQGTKRWTMRGTPWGTQGVESSRLAILMAVIPPTLLVIMLCEVAKRHFISKVD
jgi:hypothetical protein